MLASWTIAMTSRLHVPFTGWYTRGAARGEGCVRQSVCYPPEIPKSPFCRLSVKSRYSIKRRAKDKWIIMAKRTDNLGTKSIILITVLLLVVITALALVLSHRSESALAEQIQDRMLDVANTSAALLDGDALARFTPQDQETPEYQRELSLLRSFQDSVELSYISHEGPTKGGRWVIA